MGAFGRQVLEITSQLGFCISISILHISPITELQGRESFTPSEKSNSCENEGGLAKSDPSWGHTPGAPRAFINNGAQQRKRQEMWEMWYLSSAAQWADLAVLDRNRLMWEITHPEYRVVSWTLPPLWDAFSPSKSQTTKCAFFHFRGFSQSINYKKKAHGE